MSTFKVRAFVLCAVVVDDQFVVGSEPYVISEPKTDGVSLGERCDRVLRRFGGLSNCGAKLLWLCDGASLQSKHGGGQNKVFVMFEMLG